MEKIFKLADNKKTIQSKCDKMTDSEIRDHLKTLKTKYGYCKTDGERKILLVKCLENVNLRIR